MIFRLAAFLAAGIPLGSAARASPVSTQPLAAHEVLLEVSASGTATSPAELATLTGMLSTRGATEAEARRAREAEVRRIIAAARRAGVAASDVTIGDAEVFDSYTMADAGVDMAPLEAEADMSATSCNAGCPPPMTEVTLSSPVEVRFRDPARVGELIQALVGDGVDISLSAPAYSCRRPERGASRSAGPGDRSRPGRCGNLCGRARPAGGACHSRDRADGDGPDEPGDGRSSLLLNMMQQQEQATGPGHSYIASRSASISRWARNSNGWSKRAARDKVCR